MKLLFALTLIFFTAAIAFAETSSTDTSKTETSSHENLDNSPAETLAPANSVEQCQELMSYSYRSHQDHGLNLVIYEGSRDSNYIFLVQWEKGIDRVWVEPLHCDILQIMAVTAPLG